MKLTQHPSKSQGCHTLLTSPPPHNFAPFPQARLINEPMGRIQPVHLIVGKGARYPRASRATRASRNRPGGNMNGGGGGEEGEVVGRPAQKRLMCLIDVVTSVGGHELDTHSLRSWFVSPPHPLSPTTITTSPSALLAPSLHAVTVFQAARGTVCSDFVPW